MPFGWYIRDMKTKVKSKPLVSVIMPVYNCEAYVEEALASVQNQTYTNLEIIVVDDCSTDRSWEIIQRLAKNDTRIHPFKNKENLKIVGTLNFAISKSKGEYLARMDGDDRRRPKSIQQQISFLQAHPDVIMVGGSVTFCDDKMQPVNRRYYPISDEDIRAKIFRYSPFCHASIVVRSDVLEKNPYKFNWAEDYDLYFRLAKKGKLANLSHDLYEVRTHKASVSRSKTRYQEKLTLYIRLRAVFEYGYTMTAGDKFYFAAQFLTMYLMPPGFRFWLFNKLRAR